MVASRAIRKALRKEVRKRGRRSSVKKDFLRVKKKTRERVKVKLKKSVIRKRTTEEVCSGSSFKTTYPKPTEDSKVRIKTGSRNLGIKVYHFIPHLWERMVTEIR